MENKVENVPQVTLGEAKKIISALAATQSVLLLSSPGVGKSAVIRQAADEAGLECRSLLGTQIAPEDVSGIPRICRLMNFFLKIISYFPASFSAIL